jgi:1-acyl-sn-glycerol-3-phosphate acyltransferase
LIRSLRAAWRLLRATAHGFHGLFICWTEFPRATAEAKRRRIEWWSRGMLARLGIRLEVTGQQGEGAALVAANHLSWLDILAIDAAQPACFVSKSEVRDWPLLGRLVAASGTLFIDRERRRDAHRVVHRIAEALGQGERVAVFPEGEVGDGRALLPFHANLLQAAISAGAPVQPVALRYSDATDRVSPATHWVGEVTLLQSMWAIARAEGLVAHVALLEPLPTAGANRRELAAQLRDRIDRALQA